ncbi:GCN5-related N-acetyltransferase [Xylanimonas cellulosilytica DSM 15894]|uniref:GCN5-related N-acetyltransferase n=1 Tax=Xylanimonas cellulosilytica (strain DSM 15894 / JCM 12276 / CECT 5975 / KCTC 9989 / LMG 20990 / NBRC 107835 / XIL07) TaxID=446471 RepID=D1BV61_XYLCX|nr:GNAT family N-acetyltransferase [Xylanimonas cellulosilytica]ACZ31300.1 GCN5-related N-acetyltransferase [Xylanimonas cellulosilytica DSM 15894]
MTVDLDSVIIRAATPQDAARIAQVHVTSWQSAYAELLPADYLADLDPDVRAGRWASVLSTKEGSATAGHVLVAEQDGRTLGFASFGLSADEDAEPGTYELYAMYLEPGAWGRGVARELMRTVLASIPAGAVMTLWVLDGNDRAQHFYRRHGFHPDGVERIDEIGGVPLTELRFRRPGA